MKFFMNRLGFDFTYYKQNTKEQIVALAGTGGIEV